MHYLELGHGRQQSQQTPPTQFPDLRKERKAIESFVTRYYDKDNRMMKLSNLSAFLPSVKSIDFNSKRFAILLESILAVSCPDVITLVLDNNKISKLAAVAYIAHNNRLKIVNLSLDSNQLSDFNELNNLKDMKLRELVLSNNPLSAPGTNATYHLEVVRRLPDLYMLDLHQLKQEDNHPPALLPPMPENYFDNPQLQTFAFGFLQKYYDAYDNNRDALVGAYSEQSYFSLSHIPTSQPQQGRDRFSFRGDKFGAYSQLDRNINATKTTEKLISTLKTGPTHIVGTILDLPQTKHDYSSFSLDCFVANIGCEIINISAHGNFTEVGKKKRSFSRVFVLTRAPENSKHEGWPFVITNDQLYIRHYTPKKEKPTQPQIPSPEVQPTQPAQPAQPTQPASPTLTEAEMQGLITRLSSVTKFTLAVAKECLEVNKWNIDIALADFQRLMATNSIPQHYFC